MPYKIRKLPNSNRYRVKNISNGKIVAKSTTKDKAEAQVRYLNYLYGKEKRGGMVEEGNPYTDAEGSRLLDLLDEDVDNDTYDIFRAYTRGHTIEEFGEWLEQEGFEGHEFNNIITLYIGFRDYIPVVSSDDEN